MVGDGRPRALGWALGLLLASAVPWTLIFLDNTLAALRQPGATGSEGGLLLLNVGYIWLVLTIPGGRRGSLWTVTVGTALFCLTMVTSMTALVANGGSVAVALIGFATGVAAAAGLVLLWSPPVRDHLEARRAGSRP